MIEVIHYVDRYGKKRVASRIGRISPAIPYQMVIYTRRYHSGLEKPHYLPPVPLEHTQGFAIRYVVQLIAELWNTEGP